MRVGAHQAIEAEHHPQKLPFHTLRWQAIELQAGAVPDHNRL
jgi:hypothetical protein